MADMADFYIAQEMDAYGWSPFNRYHRCYHNCKYCGKKDLVWKETSNGWRLHNGDIVHTCKQYSNK